MTQALPTTPNPQDGEVRLFERTTGGRKRLVWCQHCTKWFAPGRPLQDQTTFLSQIKSVSEPLGHVFDHKLPGEMHGESRQERHLGYKDPDHAHVWVLTCSRGYTATNHCASLPQGLGFR